MRQQKCQTPSHYSLYLGGFGVSDLCIYVLNEMGVPNCMCFSFFTIVFAAFAEPQNQISGHSPGPSELPLLQYFSKHNNRLLILTKGNMSTD